VSALTDYAEELYEYHADLTKYAPNGELITLGENDRYTDALGNYGYRGHFTGAWICYTDGAYCACNEDDCMGDAVTA
jgi:hypothetical protein